MKDIFIVVPTYDPDEKIMQTFMDELLKEFKNVIVVNDGSNKKHEKFFNNLEKSGVVLFKHHKNFGKGRGIKNAFNYLLNTYPNIKGCVTCDSDGQHSVKDIKNCVSELLKNDDKLVLGVRNFDDSLVPKRSKFGNKLTKSIFKVFIGSEITDTQTGLRGFSKKLMEEFSSIPGERYEYETNMLVLCKKLDIPIKEIEIDTIYIDSNRTSHFNPVKDSMKIYKLFLKFFSLALSSYLVDLIIFIALFNIFDINNKILAATIIARLFSSIYSYSVNSSMKFKGANINYLAKYYILTIIQMILSGCFVTYFYNLTNINVVFIKIIVDTIIWIVNLFIQIEFTIRSDEYE